MAAPPRHIPRDAATSSTPSVCPVIGTKRRWIETWASAATARLPPAISPASVRIPAGRSRGRMAAAMLPTVPPQFSRGMPSIEGCLRERTLRRNSGRYHRHMSLFHELIGSRTRLTPATTDHLARLVGEWQLLADLAFADLLLLAPDRGGGFVVLAQMRPYTGQTVYQDDQVGRTLSAAEAPQAARAIDQARIVREGDPVERGGVAVRVEAIPVRFQGEVVAVVSQEQNLSAPRTPSRLELTYLRCAGDLDRMIMEGTFPHQAAEPDPENSPRVGDGLIRLDARGTVED